MSAINEKYLKIFQTIRLFLAPLLGPHGAVVQYLVSGYARTSKRVLDLGARRSPYTHGLPGMVVGLDLPAAQEEKLGFTPQSLSRYDQARRFPVFGRGEHLPFHSVSFDAVLLIEVIEHIEMYRELIKEIQRVLRPGGVLVLTTPNGDTFPQPAQHHVRHYNPAALKKLIGKYLAIERFWSLFPQGKLWDESVTSVKRLIEARKVGALLRHVAALGLYWPLTLAWFLAGKKEGTTTLLLVARKP